MVIQKVICSANCLFTHFLLRLQVAFVYSLKLFPELVSMVTKNESLSPDQFEQFFFRDSASLLLSSDSYKQWRSVTF